MENVLVLTDENFIHPYVTPLTITLDYGYTQTVSKQIKINKIQ